MADFDAKGCRVPFACAVSAYSEDDALDLLRATYAPDGDLPQPGTIAELPPAEIQKRIGSADFGVPVVRGIWYPHVGNP